MSGLRGIDGSRRLHRAALLFLATGLLHAVPASAAILIENVRIVDGSGAPARKASVLVSGDRITAVGNISAAAGDTVVDGGGLVLAPGFIDTHSHLDRTLSWISRLRPRRAILTHMDNTMDYASLAKTLPPGVEPGYDMLTVEL